MSSEAKEISWRENRLYLTRAVTPPVTSFALSFALNIQPRGSTAHCFDPKSYLSFPVLADALRGMAKLSLDPEDL